MTMHDHIDDLFAWADANIADDTPHQDAATIDAGEHITVGAPDAEVSPASSAPEQPACESPPAAPHVMAETTADALEILDRLDDLSPTARSDIRSAIKAIAKATQREPKHIPLAPQGLVPLLKSIHPARQRWSGKRWSNLRSALRTLGILTGHVIDERALPLDPNGPWARLLATLPNTPRTCCLRRFRRYCSTRGISPAEVELATLHAFREWLDHRTYEMNAGRVASVVRQAWNAQVAAIGTEGAKALPALGSPRRVSLPPEMLPSQLVGDISAYGEARRALDPFAGPAVRRSSEATIRDRMKRLTYAASLLIRAGVPTERVGCLRSLVTRDNLVDVLRRMMVASSLSEPRMHHLHTALAFIDAGTTYLQLSDNELRQLHDVRARIKPPKPGLSQRAAQRLHPFDDQRVRAKLLALPDKLFAAAALQRKAGQSVRAAETHERGLALAILLVQPLRRRALSAIDADTHFTRDERGRIVRLVLPGSVIKNGVAVDAPIDAMLAKRIEQHLTQFRPAIRGAEKCRFLFPAPDGRARTPDAVARGVTKVVKQELGVAFSIGLIRHIVATMLYESSPQAGPVAQRLLGHTSVKTTELMYGHLTTRSAHDTWARIVEKQRRRSESGGGNR